MYFLFTFCGIKGGVSRGRLCSELGSSFVNGVCFGNHSVYTCTEVVLWISVTVFCYVETTNVSISILWRGKR